MDSCPPEIHARIFSYACTDDGVTGCSLSRVSKYVRQVSSPYIWQSIALTAYTRVVRFSNLLGRTSAQRAIHHLFICDRHISPLDSSYDDHSVTYDNVFVPALVAVLEYASHTLVTLSYFSDACFVEGAAGVRRCLAVPYPRLKDMTLRACCTPSQLAGTQRGDSIVCDTPNLTHLHLALPYHGFSSDNLQATHNLVQSINRVITHLRFTMLDKWGSKRVVEVMHAELAQAGIVSAVLDLPPSDWDSPRTAKAKPVTWDRLLPASLDLFAIQPSPTSTFYCSCCMDLRGDVDVIRVLEQIARTADQDRFVYMDRRPIRVRRCRTDPMEVAGYGYAEAKQDWLERLGQGDGCWKPKEDMDWGIDSCDDIPCSSTPIYLPVAKRRSSRTSLLRKAFKKLKVW